MICLSCGHYIYPDREMAREQNSDECRCGCHHARPMSHDPEPSFVSFPQSTR